MRDTKVYTKSVELLVYSEALRWRIGPQNSIPVYVENTPAPPATPAYSPPRPPAQGTTSFPLAKMQNPQQYEGATVAIHRHRPDLPVTDTIMDQLAQRG